MISARSLGIAGQRLAGRHEHAHQMLLQHLRFAGRAAFEERARIRPDVAREIAEFGPRQQIALQAVDAAGIVRIAAEPVDERQHHAIELAAERMFWIVADFVEEGGRRRHDLVHQKPVGAIEL